VDGPQRYDKEKTRLELAIREYDQAVFHLAARTISGSWPETIFNALDISYDQRTFRKQNQDEGFLKWLSPSYWPVEAQLSFFRQKRTPGTLKWAEDMHDFHVWRTSELGGDSKDRILWIRGAVGIGKSTMAAYFIDLLKFHYPDAILAYFFCRHQQPGLTKPIELLRTLAYHCVEDDPQAQAILQGLRTKDFTISEDLGIAFLFDKLVLEPLQNTKREIFIVLDGLDEADPSGCSDLETLLKCLTKISSARILFLSRHLVNVSAIIPRTNTRSITKDENSADIVAFVERSLSDSPHLGKLFESENKNPTDYFRDAGRGIFLWVFLVMQQLSRARTRSVFRKYLEGFSDASGSMKKLYSTVLGRIEEDDRPWIKEILRWVLFTETPLTVQALQRAVEWELDDSHTDFPGLLEVDCGSIVHLLPSESTFRVEPIHETFSSFMLDATKCPPSFALEAGNSHCILALNCLTRLLRNHRSDAHVLTEDWPVHLEKGGFSDKKRELLIAIHTLFTDSPSAFQRWTESNIMRPGYPPLRDTLRQIGDWLGKASCTDLGESPPEELSRATEWAAQITVQPLALGILVGKAAIRLWAASDEKNINWIRRIFDFGLKYYLKGLNNSLHVIQQNLITEFRDIVNWAEYDAVTQKPSAKTLGLTYLLFQRWEKSIRCFHVEGKCLDLVTAYRAIGNYEKAMELLALDGWQPGRRDYLILKACTENAACTDLGIAILEKDIATTGNEARWDTLSRLYRLNVGHGARHIHKLQGWGASCKGDPQFWRCLARAYMQNGEHHEAIVVLEKVVDKNGHDTWCIDLLQAYIASNQHDAASIHAMKGADMSCKLRLFSQYTQARDGTGMLRVLSDQRSTPNLTSSLRSAREFRAYVMKKDFLNALETLRTLFELSDSWERYLEKDDLLEFCEATGEYNRTIHALEVRQTATRESKHTWLYYTVLCFQISLYLAQSNYEGAIKVFQRAPSSDYDIETPFEQRQALELVFPAFKKFRDYDEIVPLLQNAIGLRLIMPYSWPVRTLADLHAERGLYDHAIELIESAAKIYVQDYALPKQLGDIFLNKGEFQRAVDSYRTAVNKAFQKSFEWAYLDLEPFHLRSQANFGSELKLKTAFVWFSYSEALERNGEYECARAVYDAAIDGYQTSLRQRENTLLWRHEDPPTSFNGRLDCFDRKENLPQNITWAALGAVYRARGDIDNAIHAFRNAIEMDLKTDWIENAIRDLERRKGCSASAEVVAFDSVERVLSELSHGESS